MSESEASSVVAEQGAEDSLAFDLVADAKGRWVLKRPGKPDVEEVRIRRAFPWSLPDQFVSIRGKDGKELLMIEKLSDLEPQLADKVRAALHLGSLIPKIKRIIKLELQFGHQLWQTETDRGMLEFRVQEREDIRFLSDGRFSVKDAYGNIYELPAERDMDPQTLKLIQQMI
jgi:hypothetical protein